MIDIHCHLLYGVDDGPAAFAESVEMLAAAKSQGVDGVILTPHYRHGLFPYDKETIADHLCKLLPQAQRIGINLELGCEYHVDSEMVHNLQTRRVMTLADTGYVLTEYSGQTEYGDVRSAASELIRQGYVPVIAHAERIRCLLEEPGRVSELRSLGAYVQINCDAVLGLDGRAAKRFAARLLETGEADVIASDSHGISARACHMARCYAYVEKKYGTARAERMMTRTPGRIWEGKQ